MKLAERTKPDVLKTLLHFCSANGVTAELLNNPKGSSDEVHVQLIAFSWTEVKKQATKEELIQEVEEQQKKEEGKYE